MSIDNNSARTLSGISNANGGNLSIPSTPDSIRIAGQSGQRGYLVGVDINSGNVDWVQAGTPFIPNDSILGVDLNSNIGFSTTASETGGIISITNPAGTGTLQADRVVATDFTLQNNFSANQGIFKDKVIMDTTGLGTGDTRKIDLVASNGDIIQYETFTTGEEFASIKSGVGTFRSITATDDISTTNGNITTQAGNITAVGSLGATQNVVANVGMTTGTLTATGTSTLNDTTTTSLLYTTSLIGRRTLLAGGNVDMFSVVMDDDGSVLTLKDGDDNSTIILDSDTGDSTLANLTTTSIDCNGNLDCSGNLVVDLLTTLKGNTEIQGNLSVLGNLTYGGDLNFNDLIFDGFFSQRLDGNDANEELVSSVITNSDANNYGGSVFKLKKKTPPQSLNIIQDSITFDSRVGSIDCSSITTTDLTATNFTFDNNLLVKTLTADDINVVNKNGGDATTIALAGETGALTLSGSEGKLTSVEVETSGDLIIGGDTTLSGNTDMVGNLVSSNGDITLSNGDLYVGGSTTLSGNTDFVGNLTSTNGNITMTNGNITLTNGTFFGNIDGTITEELVDCQRLSIRNGGVAGSSNIFLDTGAFLYNNKATTTQELLLDADTGNIVGNLITTKGHIILKTGAFIYNNKATTTKELLLEADTGNIICNQLTTKGNTQLGYNSGTTTTIGRYGISNQSLVSECQNIDLGSSSGIQQNNILNYRGGLHTFTGEKVVFGQHLGFSLLSCNLEGRNHKYLDEYSNKQKYFHLDGENNTHTLKGTTQEYSILRASSLRNITIVHSSGFSNTSTTYTQITNYNLTSKARSTTCRIHFEHFLQNTTGSPDCYVRIDSTNSGKTAYPSQVGGPMLVLNTGGNGVNNQSKVVYSITISSLLPETTYSFFPKYAKRNTSSNGLRFNYGGSNGDAFIGIEWLDGETDKGSISDPYAPSSPPEDY